MGSRDRHRHSADVSVTEAGQPPRLRDIIADGDESGLRRCYGAIATGSRPDTASHASEKEPLIFDVEQANIGGAIHYI